MASKLLGSDYLLLLLYINGKEPIKGSVRLTKMMFLFNEQIVPVLKRNGLESEKLPEFIAYNYGPFSKDLYEQVDLFTGIGFMQVRDLNETEEMSGVDNIVEKEFVDECYEDDEETMSENSYREYCSPDIGSGVVVSELLGKLTSSQLGLLRQYKKKITEMTMKQLLHYVYTRYPQYAEKSLIKDEVLGNGK